MGKELQEKTKFSNIFFDVSIVFPNFFLTLEKITISHIMNNKRDLKRTINYICSDLFAECVAASLYSGKPDQENVKALLASILNIHTNYICRVSHPEPRMKKKLYFQDLIKNFNKDVSEVIDQINAMQ